MVKRLLKPRAEPSFEEIMVQVRRDEKYRKTVIWICKQNEFQRRSILRTQLQIMELKRAPTELKVLFQSLEDQGFVDKTIQYLNEDLKTNS